MIELMMGSAGICLTIGFVGLIVEIYEFFLRSKSKNAVTHKEEIKIKRATKYASKKKEQDWRDFAA